MNQDASKSAFQGPVVHFVLALFQGEIWPKAPSEIWSSKISVSTFARSHNSVAPWFLNVYAYERVKFRHCRLDGKARLANEWRGVRAIGRLRSLVQTIRHLLRTLVRVRNPGPRGLHRLLPRNAQIRRNDYEIKPYHQPGKCPGHYSPA